MLIETLRLFDEDCEGYAIRIDGQVVFEYFTHYDTQVDAVLDRDHCHVLVIAELLQIAYMEGVKTAGEGRATVQRGGNRKP